MTRAKVVPVPEPYETGPELSSTPREEFEQEPAYHRPLERNVAVGPMLVSTCICPKCGEVFAHFIKMHEDSKIHNALGDDQEPVCYRCTYADKTCPPGLVYAMQQVRWLYDQYYEAHASLGGASNVEIRARFLKAYDAFWRYGPVLLAELEHVYGNQLTRGVHEIETGVAGD